MPNYDSDSSSDAGGEYTTTNVTLGYACVESTGDEISHLGGHPTWLDASRVPPATLAKCKVCNGYMSLLLQLNADLQQYFPQDERRLHVLCCRKKTCSKKLGSVRAFREVRKPQKERHMVKDSNTVPAPTQDADSTMDLGSALFGGSRQPTSTNANPFSTSSPSSQSTISNPFASPSLSTLAAVPPQRPDNEPQPLSATFADKLRISSPPQPPASSIEELWPDQTAFSSPFSTLYLDAYPEELEPDKPAPDATSGPSKSQYDADDTTSNAVDKDNFESSLDKTFQKFSDRIAQNPEQVLRYEFRGQPLLYSGADGVASRFIVPHGKSGAVMGLPRCESCGVQRVFEVQLVPGLIYELEKDDAMDLEDGMEWGTIIVGTCSNNCGEAGVITFREEWAGVQWEEGVIRK